MSTRAMTVWVSVDARGLVDDTAPVTRKFIGQSVGNLRRWLRRQGGFLEHRL